jgi:hypothetical protein
MARAKRIEPSRQVNLDSLVVLLSVVDRDVVVVVLLGVVVVGESVEDEEDGRDEVATWRSES